MWYCRCTGAKSERSSNAIVELFQFWVRLLLSRHPGLPLGHRSTIAHLSTPFSMLIYGSFVSEEALSPPQRCDYLYPRGAGRGSSVGSFRRCATWYRVILSGLLYRKHSTQVVGIDKLYVHGRTIQLTRRNVHATYSYMAASRSYI